MNLREREPSRTGLTPPHRTFTDRAIGEGEPAAALDLYRAVAASRRLDRAEADLTARGLAAFHVPCAGHEGIAALAGWLTPDDWLHLHYRDKALLLARGLAPEAILRTLIASGDAPCLGRQLPPFVSDPGSKILCQNVPVGNHAPQAVGVALAARERPGRPIVLCTMGDGTSQQGEVLEAIAEAARRSAPVLFVIEDNGLSISTRTAGATFFDPPGAAPPPEHVHGVPIHRLDARDPLGFRDALGPVVLDVRERRGPALVVASLDRLESHTNADDDRPYRSVEERARARERGDPLDRLRRTLLGRGAAADALGRIDEEVDRAVLAAVDAALRSPDAPPEPSSKAALPPRLLDPTAERRGDGPAALTIREALNASLRERLGADPGVTLHGQDIEDPKGDVFGVTRGLSTAFPGRVTNAALSESTIVGTAIGRAMAGERPVAFIQFADFLPLAFNQIHSELGSLWWRSGGAWPCPVILMVPCGGYRPGLGPFHAQTMEALLAHVPGLDVVMPSTAADAAGLLRAAFESGRPTAFLYPKALLNDRARATAADVDRQFVPLGVARRVRSGDALTIVSWGAAMPMVERTADLLREEAGVDADLLDLRSIAPWDRDAVLASARRTGKLLVVHEDSRTAGFGAEVVAEVAEAAPTVRCRRVARPDTHIPYNFEAQLAILPSARRALGAAAELLGLDLAWDESPADVDVADRLVVAAPGPSPADEEVTVLAWHVEPGQQVRAGEAIAELVADKSTVAFVAPEDGRVARLRVAEGEAVAVGAPLLELEAGVADRRPPTRERLGRPRFRRKAVVAPAGPGRELAATITLGVPAARLGSRVVTNEGIVASFPGRSAEDITKRTGIERRRRLDDGESALSMAAGAAIEALGRDGMGPGDLDALICATGTPGPLTPSLACRILHALGGGAEVPAFDLGAACAGFLFGLAAAFDFTRSRPDARVLLVTAEALSPLADPDDFDTAILFGDAATATVVRGPAAPLGAGPALGRMGRPVVSSKGEPGSVLSVPGQGGGAIRMDGLRTYAEAVRRMIASLRDACDADALAIGDLDLVIPHQANARIIRDIQLRLGFAPDRVLTGLAHLGNTSSSSIPVALATLAERPTFPRLVGLTAFGGGFTFGGAVLRTSD